MTAMQTLRQQYDQVWAVDFEYHTGPSGADAPRPICMVAVEAFSRAVVKRWLWDGDVGGCPIPLHDRSLYVAYYASAEMTCHLGLGWPMPRRLLDLLAEFRLIANSRPAVRRAVEAVADKSGKYGLLQCKRVFGLPVGLGAADYKDESRDLCRRGGPYSPAERGQILEYCQSDVEALVDLLPRMLEGIDLPYALLRGRYMGAVSVMERSGIPVDAEKFHAFRDHWPAVVDRLVEDGRQDFDILGQKEVCQRKFAVWLEARGLLQRWPRTEGNIPRLVTDADTLKDLGRVIPVATQLREYLGAIRRTRLFDKLGVGSDGRNRFLISPFASVTGRNQPSSAKSVFGPSCWVRHLIKPPPGYALLYCDWSGQEYGEAAYLSRDPKMIHDYEHDDPYLGFAKRINLAPADATKASHPVLRGQLKVAAGLGVLYGAGAAVVAKSGDMTVSKAQHLLREHRATYPTFWAWRRDVVDNAQLEGGLSTCFGWKVSADVNSKQTSLSNWPMQAHGAEMLRLACIFAVERGVQLLTPVHDALLVMAPIDAIEEVKAATVGCMQDAARLVIGDKIHEGPTLKVGVDEPVIYPNHFVDSRGTTMYHRLLKILVEVSNGAVSV